VYFGPDDPRNNGSGLHWDVHGGGVQDEETVARKQRGEPTGGLWAGVGLPSMLEYGDGYPCGPAGSALSKRQGGRRRGFSLCTWLSPPV